MKSSSPISVHILLVVLITVVSVLAVSSVVELKILERREDTELQAKGALTADRIANSLAYPLWNLNQEETERVVVHELTAPDIVRIQVFDEGGKLYVGKFKDDNAKLLDVGGDAASQAVGRYNFSRDVVFKDSRLGSVRLDVTDDHARSELNRLGWGIAIKLLLVAVLLSVALFLALRSLVIRPLSTLKSWIKSPEGVTGPAPHFKRSSEINTLADAFSEMGTVLRVKNRELESERERLEKAVAESLDLYNNAPCGYHSLDKDRVFVQINDTELKWLGLTRDEVVGKLRFDDVLTVEGKRMVEVKYPEFMTQGFMRDVEYELLSKDGTSKFVLLSSTAAYDSNGEYLMSRSTLYDIDERKKAEQALRRSEQKFATLFQASPIGIAVTRLSDGVYIEANKALIDGTGYTRSEILGRSTIELGLWPDKLDRERFLASVEEAGSVRDIEVQFRRKNGEPITTLLSGDVIEIGGEKCFLSVIQDITERRYIESLLKSNEQLLRTFIKHAPASIAMFDNQMRYLQVSDRFLADYGLQDQDLVGKDHYEVFPNLPEKWKAVHRRVLAGAHEKSNEDAFSFDGKTTEWVRWEALPWRKPGGDIGGMILMTQLITESKRSELALRASEERFSKIFDLSPFRMGIARISDGVVLDVNEAFLKETGFSRDEIVGRKMVELTRWLSERSRQSANEVLIKGESVYDIEAEVFTKSGDKRWVLASAQRVDFDEPCLLWAANDITDRKLAEDMLQASERRFAVAFNSSPVMTSVSVAGSGEFLAVNESFVKITGYSRDEAIGNTALGLKLWIDPIERDEVMQQLLERGSVRDVEMQLRVKSGERRFLLLSIEPIEVDGQACLLHAGIDITERRRAQDENRKLLHNLGERIKELTSLHNTSRVLQQTDVQFTELLREIATLLPDAFQYPELAGVRIKLGDFSIETPNFKSDNPILLTECETRDGLKGSVAVAYCEPCPPAAEGPFLLEERALMDTLAEMLKAACEQRQAEALVKGQREVLEMIALGESLQETLDALLRLIEKQAVGMRCSILTLDPDGIHLRYASAPSLPEEFGRSVDGMPIGPNMGSCGTSAYLAEPVLVSDVQVDSRWEDHRAVGSKYGFRACWSTPIFDLQQKVIGTFACYFPEPQLPTPHQFRLIEVATNIAAVCIGRKREEEALQASELRYRSLYETAPDSVRVFDSDLKLVMTNQQGVKLFGYDNAEEMIGLRAGEFVVPELRAQRQKAVDRVMSTGEMVVYETIGVRKDGSRFDLESRLSRTLDSTGQPRALLSVGVDITERKRAEAALRQSEEAFRTLSETIPAVICIYRAGRLIYVNSAAERLTGYSREELGQIDLFELIHPDSREIARKRIEALEAGSDAVQELEHKLVTRTGGEHWMSARAAPINFRGEASLIITSFEITERKRAEEALRASEERYRTLFETAPNAISVFDSHLRLQMTNERAAKLYGFDRASDLLDVDVLGFVAPEDRPRIKELFTRIQTSGSLEMFESSGIRKDGKPFRMETLATLLPNADSTSPSILTVNTDITERKEAEKALKDSEEQLRALSAKIRSTREEEGTRIAREIHDELGGALTGLKWDLEGIDSRLAGDGNGTRALPELRKRINSMTGLIESTIKTVRRISSELRPGVLDDLGLVAAIEWQGQQFQWRTGLKFHFDTELDIAEINREGATAVFRIFQEVLTNVLRHSQAQNIYVKLLDRDDVIELEVRDDGRGITEREKRNTRSLGLLGMKERALLVGGNITIRGAKGRGTTVTVRVPKDYELI